MREKSADRFRREGLQSNSFISNTSSDISNAGKLCSKLAERREKPKKKIELALQYIVNSQGRPFSGVP